MAKAKKVDVVEGIVENNPEGAKVVSSVQSGIQMKDLSQEKRFELYNTEFTKWKNDMADKYGLMIDVEVNATPKGIYPSLVLVDLMKKQNGEQGQQTETA